ncbi:dapper homolog 3 [Paramormyrops kingsleyae]|uniref:dapper homolog 3 n=1 Tax=Paramormyrops kingsleyae TaxID=1676925 RepID=UPI003B974079
MYRAFSFPMSAERSRNKERLEASLAGLCELELLKQRQECLVLSALSLGDATPGQPAWGDLQPPRSAASAQLRSQDDLTLRRQLNSLQCHPWSLLAALEQQVGELRVGVEPSVPEGPSEVGDSRPSSGFYEQSEGRSSAGLSDTLGELPSPSCPRPTRPAYPGERPKSVGEAFGANRDGMLDMGSRPAVPRSFSAPYPSLEGIAEGAAEEDPWLWDSHCPSELEGEPTAEDYKQAQRVESYILGLIQRRAFPQRPSKPRTSLGPPDSRGVVRQSSLCRKEPPLGPELRNVSPGLEGQAWACRSLDEQHYAALPAEDALPVMYALPRQAALTGLPRSASVDYAGGGPDPSVSESDSPQHFPSYPAPDSPSSYDQMVSAQYIPAQPCRTPSRAPTHRPPAAPKPGRAGYSPEQPQPRSRAVPKKCRFSEERPASRKPGRKACRSQSENSLLGQRGGTERKYNTVERDGGRGGPAKSRRPPQGNSSYRRWRSTLELSQDEGEHPGEQGPARRPRKPRAPGPPYPYSHGPPHGHHHPEYLEHALMCRPEDGPPAPGESESSLSEAESPGSTSLSSDSDESGGLVWPQQLPPQLAPPSPPALPGAPTQPKAFVKIKASHALKKKILRFRTGSLKVMTTV